MSRGRALAVWNAMAACVAVASAMCGGRSDLGLPAPPSSSGDSVGGAPADDDAGATERDVADSGVSEGGVDAARCPASDYVWQQQPREFVPIMKSCPYSMEQSRYVLAQVPLLASCERLGPFSSGSGRVGTTVLQAHVWIEPGVPCDPITETKTVPFWFGFALTPGSFTVEDAQSGASASYEIANEDPCDGTRNTIDDGGPCSSDCQCKGTSACLMLGEGDSCSGVCGRICQTEVHCEYGEACEPLEPSFGRCVQSTSDECAVDSDCEPDFVCGSWSPTECVNFAEAEQGGYCGSDEECMEGSHCVALSSEQCGLCRILCTHNLQEGKQCPPNYSCYAGWCAFSGS